VEDGAIPDHTFQYANKIKVSGREGKVFTASYTVKSLHGLCTINRLTFTKANAELRPFIRKFREVRKNAGVQKLKRFETDNIGGDGKMWLGIFPEPKEDVQAYTAPDDDGFAYATMDVNEINYITTRAEADAYALSVYGEGILDGDAQVIYGFDTEWNDFDDTRHITRVASISILGMPTAVIRL
jgi:hypothetical protein